jgi:hypothetical protein
MVYKHVHPALEVWHPGTGEAMLVLSPSVLSARMLHLRVFSPWYTSSVFM